ncbi:uncharacterized protein KY384_000648 [Bacidia gigantensis]|uniref:uncharacterized protein n=1 Tax=Bacidia gigantensis TaxID=2732470 RepID=UPI001D044F90|nr:uncharacterized protein KY384_000648 [Bacidia gigantensis]KAG8525888.1 hypothetical protein KY384_000648 [Bacidia gigantensis]
MPTSIETPSANVGTKPGVIASSDAPMASESQWFFSEEELTRTPSILQGLSPAEERENRSKGVNFILQVGIMLKLPQITLATASIYLHRFYMRYPMDFRRNGGYHYYSMAAACLFLAIKVEENNRKLKELVVASVRVAQKNPYKEVDIVNDPEYWKWRDIIIRFEDTLLDAICFDLSLDPPYKTLYDFLLVYGEENNKKLRNSAWAFISDSYLTTLCLLFPSRTIAGSALYAAARHSGVAFPDDSQGRPWWEFLGINLEDISSACDHLAKMYRAAPTKGGRDDILYETTGPLNEGDDKTRLLSDHSGAIDNADNPSQNLLKRVASDNVLSNETFDRTDAETALRSEYALRKRRKLDHGIEEPQPDDRVDLNETCTQKIPNKAIHETDASTMRITAPAKLTQADASELIGAIDDARDSAAPVVDTYTEDGRLNTS